MQLQVFNHKDLGQVRVVGDNDNPLFCLSDVCKVLELTTPARVAESIKAEFELGELNSYSFDTGFGVKDFTMITEPQLYFVLMRSDKPKAKPFRQWVVSEVLPSIRKQGYYGDKPQEIDFLKEKIALQQELITTKSQLIALQQENIKSLKKQQSKARLTRKEKIFALLGEGKSQSQVSRELGISRGLVFYYVQEQRKKQNEKA